MILSSGDGQIFKAPMSVMAAGFVGPSLTINSDAIWDETKLPLNPDDLVQKIMGQPMRRAGRFIKLVCCGALACLQGVSRETLQGKNVGIFLATGLGNIDEILPFITQVFKHDGGFPSPNQFANSVSNAAAFFLARAADIKGVVLTVSEEEMSFESALWLAQTYLESGEIDFALVGGCDVFTPAVAQARERINLTADNSRFLPIGEGSSWLLLGQNQEKKLGDILAISFASPRESGLFSGAEEIDRFFLPGFRIKEEQIDTWKEKNWQLYDYLPCCGIHSVASAYGIAHALLSEKTGSFLHYNINAAARHAFILARKK